MQKTQDIITELTIDDATIAAQFDNARGKSLLKFVFILLITATLFFPAAFIGIQYALNNLLVEKSDSLGMGWAHHLETQFPEAGKIAGVTSKSSLFSSHTKSEMAELIDGMFQVGSIYQLDLINPDCNCSATFGLYTANRGKHAHHNHIDQNMSKSDEHNHQATIQPVNSGTSIDVQTPSAINEPSVHHDHADHANTDLSEAHNHPELIINSDLSAIWPMNYEAASEVAASGTHPSVVVYADIANQPSIFGEVYHPVYADGELKYIIRVLVNLEEANTTFTKALYGGAAFIFILLIAAASCPFAKYSRTSKAQRKIDVKAHFLATHDVLTNTYNRNAFQDYAPKILKSCGDRETSAIIFLFDLDNFKEINDYYSHHAGDQILCAFAQTLKSNLPKNGHLARLGGDEFVVIISDIDPTLAIDEILEVPEELATEIDNGRQIIHAAVSAGVAIYPRDGSNINELMRNADLALYSAKSESKKQLCEYDAQMGKVFNDRLDLRDEFKFALLESHTVYIRVIFRK